MGHPPVCAGAPFPRAAQAQLALCPRARHLPGRCMRGFPGGDISCRGWVVLWGWREKRKRGALPAHQHLQKGFWYLWKESKREGDLLSPLSRIMPGEGQRFLFAFLLCCLPPGSDLQLSFVGPSRMEPMGLVLFYSEIATDVSPYLWVSQPKEQRPRGMAGTQGAGRTWGWGRGCVPGVPGAERGPWGLLLTRFSEISQKDTTSSAFSCLSRMLGTSLGGKPSTERPGHRAPSPHADALRGFLPAPDAAKQPKSVHP